MRVQEDESGREQGAKGAKPRNRGRIAMPHAERQCDLSPGDRRTAKGVYLSGPI